MDFSAAEKDSGVKLCMLVRLLSGMSFSHFGELGSHGVTAVALLPRCMHRRTGATLWLPSMLGGAVGIGGGSIA